MAFKSRFLAQLDHSICQSRLTIYHFFPGRERFFDTPRKRRSRAWVCGLKFASCGTSRILLIAIGLP
jgi:hypothetical protein